nr:hypothetical protein [Enterococcus faecium]
MTGVQTCALPILFLPESNPSQLLPVNGRVDLSQAEAVMDLIRAKTDKAMGLALKDRKSVV